MKFVVVSSCVTVGVLGLSALAADTVRPDWASALLDGRLWAGFAGGPERLSIAAPGATGPVSISFPRFVADGDEDESFVLYGQTGVVVTDDLVIGVGYRGESGPRGSGGAGQPDGLGTTVGETATAMPIESQRPLGSDAIAAFSRLNGALVWSASIPLAILDSWSSPCLDIQHGTVIVAAGSDVLALSLDDGSPVWSTDLGRIVVNASPAVTADLGPADRLFITDHSYATGSDGRLFCLNIDPFDAARNPYQPGEIVWSVDLDGQTSGCTPAYAGGMVYVATSTGGTAWDQGTIQAYDATRRQAPAPKWVYQHTDPTGFFSGPVIRGDALYASTYSFQGLQYSASTIRLDRSSGVQKWSVPTNRTDVSPVPLGDGRVLVSGGIPFNEQFPAFGSLPSLQLIYETPWGSAARVWDSAYETHQDSNNDGDWDPGESFLSIGGWTIQPVVVERGGVLMAYVGASPDPTIDGFFGASDRLVLVNLDKRPDQAGFIVQSVDGCGASPAVVGDELYSVGAAGLYGFGLPPMNATQVVDLWNQGRLPDVNGDGRVDLSDLYLALQNTGG